MPVATASATADPDTPAMTKLVMMDTCPRLPLSRPTSAMAQSIRRIVRPPLFMSSPANMNRGTWTSAKLSTPEIIDSGIIAASMASPGLARIPSQAEKTIEKPTSNPIRSANRNATKSRASIRVPWASEARGP